MWLDVLMCVYPQAWRERYEDEYRAMLEQCDLSLADWLDMLVSACETRLLDTKGYLMKDLLNRVTGVLVVLSGVLMMSAFFIPDENTAEFFFAVGPLLSLAMIPAMHRVLSIHRPQWSRAVMAIGVTSILLLIVTFKLGAMAILPDTSLMLISFSAMVILGVWLVSVNGLAISTGTIPNVFGAIGVAIGVAWIIVMSVSLWTSLLDVQLYQYPALMTLQSISILMLLGCYILWAISTGILFISGNVSRKLQVSYG
ncbi:MAG: hypothetical protein AAFR67_07755 [Chloroflexota bacterium]